MPQQTHLETAFQIGVQHAIKEAGYTTVEELTKEAQELGLFEQPKTAATDDAGALAALRAKIGQ